MNDSGNKISFQQTNAYMDLRFYYYGSEGCAPNHSWGPGMKDHYKIHYIHSGKGTFRTHNQAYSLTGGQGFLICPGQVSYYQADENDPWTYSWVAFNGTYAQKFIQLAGFSINQPLFECGQDDYIQSCFRHMHESNKQSNSRELKLTAALYSFLSVILDSTQTGSKNRKV